MPKLALMQKKLQSSQLIAYRKQEEKLKGNHSNPHLDPRAFGNQALQRLLRLDVSQTKLKIGNPDDEFEREADRLAEQVMNIPTSKLQRSTDTDADLPNTRSIDKPIYSPVQRRKKSLDEKPVQKKASASEKTPIGQGFEAKIRSLRRGGRPLSRSERAFFEPRFGYNFDKVQVHTGEEAVALSHSIGARAFTIGSDIFFGKGEYNPVNSSARVLLAHELSHVMQQANGQDFLQLVRFSNNGVDFDFDPLRIVEETFNSGPGSVGMGLNPQVIQLAFYSAAPNAPEPSAWRFSTLYEFNYVIGEEASASGHYIGFIQDAERLEYVARWDGGIERRALVTNARDPFDPSAPIPWFNLPNAPGGPVDLWTSENSPFISDMPYIRIRAWAHQNPNRNPLRSVNASGRFNIWLAAKHQNDTPDIINFLYNINVEFNRSWNFIGEVGNIIAYPSPSDFSASGGQSKTENVGMGPRSPIISGQTVNEQLDRQLSAWSFP